MAVDSVVAEVPVVAEAAAVDSVAVEVVEAVDLDSTSPQIGSPSLDLCPTHVKKISYSERPSMTCHTSTLLSISKTNSQSVKLMRFSGEFVNILSQLSYQKM